MIATASSSAGHISPPAADGALQPRHRAFVAIFGSVALVFTLLFAATVPVGFGLDEEHHTYRAWQISRGILTPETLTPGKQFGGHIPAALVEYVVAGTDAANAARGTGPFWDREDVSLAPDFRTLGAMHLTPDSELRAEEFTNAGASTFVPYLPAAFGMRMGTFAGLDVGGIVLLSKLCNALVYVAITTLAIVSLRRSRWRWLAAVIALIPLSVFQAAALTADTVSNAAAILFVSLTLAMMRAQSRMHYGWLAMLAVSAVGLIASKPTYAVLLVLLLALPAASLGASRRVAWLIKIGALGGLAVLALIVVRGSNAIAGAIKYQVPNADHINQSEQLNRLLTAPWSAVGMLARTFVEFGSSWIEGSLTMFGTNIVLAPQPTALALIAVLILCALRGDRHPSWRGWVLVATTALSCAAVIGALYTTFTAIGSPAADGVQGRYWIPLFLPLLAGLGIVLPARVEMSERACAFIFGTVVVGALAVSLTVWVSTVY